MLTSLCCFWLLFVFVVRCLMCAGGLIVAMGFAGLGWVYMVLFLFAVVWFLVCGGFGGFGFSY